MIDTPDGLAELLHRPSPCLVAITLPDGSPHLTQTLVDIDGEHILINPLQGYRKLRHLERDPRVAVSELDPEHPSRYYAIRGHILNTTSDGAAEHIELLAHKYLDGSHPWFDDDCEQARIKVNYQCGKTAPFLSVGLDESQAIATQF